MRTVFGLLMMLVLVMGHAFASTPANREDLATAALFTRFETVFRVSPELLLKRERLGRANFVWEPFGYVMSALGKLDTDMQQELLNQADAVLVGTKDYRPPQGLGRIVSTRCYMLIMKKPYIASNALEKKMGRAWPLYGWSAELREFGEGSDRPSSIYATEVQGNLIICNDSAELTVLTSLLREGRGLRALDSFDGLGQLRRHEFWGYRRYLPFYPATTSPDVAGIRGIGPDAEALGMYIEGSRGILLLFCSGTEPRTPEQLNSAWKDRIPPFRRVRPDIWRTTFPLGTYETPVETPLLVMWLFGQGVAV
jgi:hypothetical protein